MGVEEQEPRLEGLCHEKKKIDLETETHSCLKEAGLSLWEGETEKQLNKSIAFSDDAGEHTIWKTY